MRPVAIRRVVMVSILILFSSPIWIDQMAGQVSPSRPALDALEALRAAEAAGANVVSMVSKYNSLLQQTGSDASFNSLQNDALTAQQNAVATQANDKITTAISVPIIALLLALVTASFLQLRRRLERERLMDMEIQKP